MRDSFTLYTDQLKGEYAEVFKQIQVYTLAQSVDEDTYEAHLGELLDIFLNAQNESKPIEKIVGDDIESFCKNFCAEFGWKQKIMNIVDQWRKYAWVIFGIEVFEMILISVGILFYEEPVSNLWSQPSALKISAYVIAFLVMSLIDMVVDYFISKRMFKLGKGKSYKKFSAGVKGLSLIGSFLVYILILSTEKLNFLIVSPWVLVVVSGTFLIGYYIVNRERVRERRANRVSLWGIFKDAFREARSDETEFLKSFEKEMEKIRARKNKSLLKKGKKAMTQQEFLVWRKDYVKSGGKFKAVYDWAPVVFVILFGILGLKNGMMINLEFIGYLVVIFVLEFLFFKAIWKLVHKLDNYGIKQIEKLQKYLSEKEAEETI